MIYETYDDYEDQLNEIPFLHEKYSDLRALHNKYSNLLKEYNVSSEKNFKVEYLNEIIKTTQEILDCMYYMSGFYAVLQEKHDVYYPEWCEQLDFFSSQIEELEKTE
jgi:hypothetical protein